MTCQSRLLEYASLLLWQRGNSLAWILTPVIKSLSNIGLTSADKENRHGVVAWQNGLSICHATLANIISRSRSYLGNTDTVKLKITSVTRSISGIQFLGVRWDYFDGYVESATAEKNGLRHVSLFSFFANTFQRTIRRSNNWGLFSILPYREWLICNVEGRTRERQL